MAWLIIYLIWVTVTVIVSYPYVEKIEKLRSGKERFFSYFVLTIGGWSMFIAKFVEKVLEKTGVLEDNEKSLW